MHIGLDIGGTKIAGIALDERGVELSRLRIATPQNYEALLGACEEVVRQLSKGAQSYTLGTCMPGAVDAKAGMVRFAPNIHDLANKPFAADMQKRLSVPVKMANDAACFALSEVRDGAAAGLGNVYGVILGTGVGGCPVINGKIVHGPNSAHEWGHIPLPWANEKDIPARCGCGKLGCIESYLCGPALHRQIKEKLGRDLSGDELHKAIAVQDAGIMDVMEVYCMRLAKALTVLVLALDPDAIVLGGGLSNLDVLYEKVPALMPAYYVLPQVKNRILKAKHGDDSGMRGAAWL